MAEQITVARPYAEAVFRLAKESGKLAEWSAFLGCTATVVADEQMAELIANPQVGDEQIERLLFDLCAAALTEEGKNLTRLLLQNGRLTLLPAIAAQYEELRLDLEGQLEAHITSAFPMTDAQLNDLVAHLEKHFQRKVVARVTVDPELIGGAKIEAGDLVIDGTARSQLARMAAMLKS